MKKYQFCIFKYLLCESVIEIKCVNCFQLQTQVPILIIERKIHWK